ncbi:hypothetical protein Caka_0535 [Coraliomargarita akajimensis DSM 45221]|uniref:Uncharacterized protein n=1 Tax=Coraliomargarita akajimensis (strain DSM 45221 / IAM 15411 / JCM 23193 / KCTC 12865 / 04OKA010-24) TaxID=583355 RepID=D5ENQ1_CORAD|nr:hypothetical protein Caka_0535 [Coraliomargarita akajimensis DSM 45221]
MSMLCVSCPTLSKDNEHVHIFGLKLWLSMNCVGQSERPDTSTLVFQRVAGLNG